MPRIREASNAALAEAADRLRAGGLVAFPTETVYGLGADALDADAIDRIFALKGRPLDNPIIAHVADASHAPAVVAAWDERCGTLAARFWPGPLTLVAPRAGAVPARLTGGRATVAVRAPDHPVARALLAAFGGPVGAPSANRSGHVSPTTAAHVADDFPEAADLLVLDGGPCRVGIESTVLDVSVDPPRVLRPGAVSAAAIRAAIGDVDETPARAQAAGPGTRPAHYAPRAPTACVAPEDLADRLAGLDAPAVVLCLDPRRVVAPHRAVAMPADSEAYAARLYEALREADRAGPALILVERPPRRGGLWPAVHDRLDRAAAGRDHDSG
jgi:L-threonylcarbamoyladenylate synthase